MLQKAETGELTQPKALTNEKGNAQTGLNTKCRPHTGLIEGVESKKRISLLHQVHLFA